MLIGALLVSIALTRTRFGRDQLRDQLEKAFNDEFKGRIDIKRLTGNVLYDLYAGDVQIYDPQNRLVAQVDSIVIIPQWWSLLSETISVQKLTLFHPKIYAAQAGDGHWNLIETFTSRKTRKPDPNRKLWNFTSSEINIRQGSIRTTSDAPPPAIVEKGEVFDFTHTELEDVNLSAALDWRKKYKLIDITGLSARLPQRGFALKKLQGQMVMEGEQFVLNQFSLQVGNSILHLNGIARGEDFALKPFDFKLFPKANFDINLQQAHFSLADWKPIFPKLNLPDFKATAIIKGEPNRYHLTSFALRQGQNDVSGLADVQVYPDSIAVQANLKDSRISMADVEKWSPKLNLKSFRHLNNMALNLNARGAFGRKSPDLDVSGTLDFRQASVGEVKGNVHVWQNAGDPLQYRTDVQTKALNLGAITQNKKLTSRLTGAIRLDGQGTTLETLNANVRLRLKDARFDRYNADSLRVDGDVKQQKFDGTIFLARAGGSTELKGNLDFASKKPVIHADVSSHRFDFGFLAPDQDFSTRLSGKIALNGVGSSEKDFSGDVELNLLPSSFVIKGRETQTTDLFTTLHLETQPNGGTILYMDGDLATLRINSGFSLNQFVDVGQYWVNAISRTVEAEVSKRLRPDSTAQTLDIKTQQLQNERLKLIQKLGHQLEKPTNAYLKVKRGTFLTSLIPDFPYFDESVELTWNTKGSADAGSLELHLHGDSLAYKTLRLSKFDVNVNADSRFADNLTNNLKTAIFVKANQIYVNGNAIRKPDLAFTYQYGGGELYLTAEDVAGFGALKTWSNFDILKDRNRLTVVEFVLTGSKYRWSIPRDQIIDLYTDAVHLNDLVVERREPDPRAKAHTIRANGILSALPEDQVVIRAENINLKDLAEQVKFKEKANGTLTGEFTIRKLFSQPDINGAITVEAATLNGTEFGTVNIHGDFDPKTYDLAFTLDVRQPKQATFQIRQNDATFSGKIGLPIGQKPDGSKNNGYFDVVADLRHMDIFFFKTLFKTEIDRPEGWGYGTATIKGDFAKPIFNGEFQFPEGRFLVPYFNLTYSLSGPLSVDEQGFHLNQMTLTDPTGGQAKLNGSILFNSYRYFSFDLAADLDKLQIINVPFSKTLWWYGLIWASGPATLKGPLNKTFLNVEDMTTTANSQLFIPITGSGISSDEQFITFADSTGKPPEPRKRTSLLSQRGTGERTFLDGLEMSCNIHAVPGSTIHLVFDPLLNDVIHARGSGDLQMQYLDSGFTMYGDFNVDSGDYLFTAFDVIRKPFKLEKGGKMTWTGDPINAQLNIPASYKTQASTVGLPDVSGVGLQNTSRIPIKVAMDITGDVNSPTVDLKLAVDRDLKTGEFGNYESLETEFNREDRATSYAFSVLLANSFVLSDIINNQNSSNSVTETTSQVVFTSMAQLVSAYLNRVVSQVLPNADINLGIYQGSDLTRLNELGLTAGVALRFLNERIVIRGEGIVPTLDNTTLSENRFSGEVVFEYKLSPNVSIQAFYRKNDRLTGTTDLVSGESVGLGFNLQRTFADWKRILKPKKPQTAPSADTARAHLPAENRP